MASVTGKTPPGEVPGEDREQQLWNEFLSMIRGTHPRCHGNPQYLIGIQPGYGPRYVPVRDLYHVLVTGLTGSGKSVFLLSQILQDIYRGNSVFVFDPHGDLVEKVLTHVPRERWDDVVYVNPLTAKEYGRVVRYNFLEIKEGEEPSIVKRSFMDALHKNYPDFWGPRLDAIISHAIDLLFKSPETPTLPKLGRILSKDTYREILLEQCKDEAVNDFWRSTFKKYEEDAITSAQNKLYRILEETLIEPITAAERSTIDFGNLMQEGKIVLFDLREGALTGQITSFIGTLFLARIYQAGMAREKIPEGERVYCRVYVDEASRFLTGVLKENMQALRKYNVFLTVVCQNLDQFSNGVRSEGGISQYTSTVVAFQSSQETARSLEGFFPKLPAPIHKHLEQTKFHSFYISTLVGTKRENYYIQSIDPGIGENRPEEVIRHSLERYGERYDVQAKRPVLELPPFEFGPAAFFALSELEQRGEMSEEALQEKLGKFAKMAVRDALFRTLYDRGWATYEWKEGTAKTKQRFWRITEAGLEVLYPTVKISGNRLGGAKHITMLCLACKLYRELGFYPMLITGKSEYDTVTIQEGQRKVDVYPDIILFSPYPESTTRFSPTSWDVSRAIAVEIEAYPTGGKHTGAHLDRTRAHFVKARDILEMPVIFVVHTEREAEAVRRAIQEEGANIVPDVKAKYAPGNASVRALERALEKALDSSVNPALAMQIRKLCAMSKDADISEVAEPEDFIEEKLPEYVSHRWYEKMVQSEIEAERKAKAAAKEEREKELEIQLIEMPKEQQPAPATAVALGEKKEEDAKDLVMQELKRLRRQRIEPLKEDGWVFWKERLKDIDHLYAGKVLNGNPERVHVDFFDDAAKEVVSELGISLEPCCPEQFSPESRQPKFAVVKPPEEKEQPQPGQQVETPPAPSAQTARVRQLTIPPKPSEDRESKVVELKQMGAKWYIDKKSDKQYVRVCVWEEGKRKYIRLGLLDEELRQILKKHNVILQ
ncbi:MAG: DUF87 domain-containing protein [Hadesarchaea archaeon]|nr:DUF87 domain-containing protein [Hadesarchaea archaeon]